MSLTFWITKGGLTSLRIIMPKAQGHGNKKKNFKPFFFLVASCFSLYRFQSINQSLNQAYVFDMRTT